MAILGSSYMAAPISSRRAAVIMSASWVSCRKKRKTRKTRMMRSVFSSFTSVKPAPFCSRRKTMKSINDMTTSSRSNRFLHWKLAEILQQKTPHMLFLLGGGILKIRSQLFEEIL